MGVKIRDLIKPKTIEYADLYNKILAVDAFNMLYQFITTIRQPDGSPLTDENGKVTSHLIGLFYRLSNLIKMNMKLVFVFDGESPELKKQERDRRKDLKSEAQRKYDEAKEAENVEGMKKYAGRTSVLTKEMIAEAKELITALGIPIVQAPSEGEAQAAHMVAQGDAYAVMSQDADSLLFGASRVVRNLSISQRRKKTSKIGYDKVLPELITADDVFEDLQISKEQMIILGMLVGTDFNIGGIKGIGPKNALKLVKEYEKRWDELFAHVEWSSFFDTEWKDVYRVFTEMPVNEDYDLSWSGVDGTEVKRILVREHAFSDERVDKVLQDIGESDIGKQKGLNDFF
ncbi:MAG: flap endonuclease-1 [Nanoarchaeota archaeon]